MARSDPLDKRGAAAALPCAQHVETLRLEGVRLGEVAGAVPIDAPIPGCPGWTVEDLLRHVGEVHRWAATVVRERSQERLRRDFVGPSGDELLAWYVEGHAELLQVLEDASPEDVFWAWAPAPSALAFWARRQAHETAIHRLDAEQAADMATPFGPLQAADGIEEWLTLASLRIRATPGGGRTLHLVARDVDMEWAVWLKADGLSLLRLASRGDCRVRADASDLFALAMNRRGAAGLEVDGDPDVLAAWRDSVRF